MIRLFLAIPLSQAVSSTLAQMIERFKQPNQSINWVKPGNAHLTLRFIGETEESSIPKLVEALDLAAARYTPFETTFDRLGGFPDLKRPKIIYLGMKEMPTALAKLADSVEQQVQAAGFAAEQKRFRPHLTLARVKRTDGLEKLLRQVTTYQFKPACQTIDRVELIQSTLTPAGASYRPLHCVSLTERFQ